MNDQASEQRIRVLLVEDDPDYSLLMNAYLNEACGGNVRYLLECAESMSAALELLSRKEYDIILLDLMLPDSAGLETVTAARSRAPGVPVLVLTNLDQEEVGLEAIAHGAQDFIPKHKVDAQRLRHAVSFALERNRLFRRVEALVEKTPDGIAIVDRQGTVRFANAAAQALLRVRPGDPAGAMFGPVAGPEKTVEYRIDDDAGQERVAEIRSVDIEWRGYAARLASIRDVTEYKKLEQTRAEIRERRRMDELKDKLLSTVAHELRTPLSIVKGVIGTIRDHLAGPTTKDQDELIRAADKHMTRLTRILNNFLDLTRLESSAMHAERRPIQLLGLVTDAAEDARMIPRDRSPAFLLDLPTELPAVYADDELIVQVLGNLIENAARYARARVLLRAARKGDEIVVSVIDDGPGLPANRAEELFDKFVQLDRPKGGAGYKGTGLGLAICREILRLNEGRIWAENAPGWGASFNFALPIAKGAESGAAGGKRDDHA